MPGAGGRGAKEPEYNEPGRGSQAPQGANSNSDSRWPTALIAEWQGLAVLSRCPRPRARFAALEAPPGRTGPRIQLTWVTGTGQRPFWAVRPVLWNRSPIGGLRFKLQVAEDGR
jgi:hypothetical protein